MSTRHAARCCGETNRLNPRRGGTGNILGQFLVPLALPSRSPSGIARFSTREMYRAEIDTIPEALYTSADSRMTDVHALEDCPPLFARGAPALLPSTSQDKHTRDGSDHCTEDDQQ